MVEQCSIDLYVNDVELAERIGRAAVRVFPSSALRKIPVCVHGDGEWLDCVRRGVLLGSGKLSSGGTIKIEGTNRGVLITLFGPNCARRMREFKQMVLSMSD